MRGVSGKENAMNKGLAVISGIGMGTGLMYLFDPDRGKRRRAHMRDKAVHGLSKTSDVIEKTARDVGNRARGIVAEAESLFARKEATDEVLEARVRSKLGRVVSHPRAIKVDVREGVVTLSGPVLQREVDRLLDSVSSVKGVRDVENNLEAHEKAEDVPALQGGRPRTGNRLPLMKTNWSPTTRVFAGAAGSALAVYAGKRGGLLGAATGTLGVGLLTRALTNLEVARLVGINDRRGLEIQKTINIAAPIEQVFDFWMRHENFPRFMTNVREVKETAEGRYHWVVAGPAGVAVEWDAEITKLVPNRLLAWKSLPGVAIEQAGVIHFTALAEGETTVDIHMSYNPPAGAIGHIIAMLFGSDPKTEMDQDLMRMKSFIETGQIPHDAARKSSLVREANAGSKTDLPGAQQIATQTSV